MKRLLLALLIFVVGCECCPRKIPGPSLEEEARVVEEDILG